VNVTVLDANDNAPSFERTRHEVGLNENIAVGSVILKLKAQDIDEGVNARVSYSFTKQTEDEFGALFGIMSETGMIFTKNDLDFEVRSNYSLYVIAADNPAVGESLFAQTLVVISVTDVNDNSPYIRINNVSPTGGHVVYPEVMEGSDVGSFVAHVTVDDKDDGANGMFHCSIQDSTLFDLTQMYTTEFKVVTLAKFDREVRDVYDFTITCRDNGRPSLTSHAQVCQHILRYVNSC